MMETLTYLIRKETMVWVVRNLYPEPCCHSEYELFRHEMKRDMTFVYPYPPGTQGPGVVALFKHRDKLSAAKRSDFRQVQFVVPISDPNPETHNILSMLEKGFDWFATKNLRFPFIAAQHTTVDSVSENGEVIDDPWDIEDCGDGLKIYRKNPLKVSNDLQAYTEMMAMAQPVLGPPT